MVSEMRLFNNNKINACLNLYVNFYKIFLHTNVMNDFSTCYLDGRVLSYSCKKVRGFVRGGFVQGGFVLHSPTLPTHPLKTNINLILLAVAFKYMSS